MDMTSATGGAADHSSRQNAEQCAVCAHQNDCHACFEELVRRFQSKLLHFLLRHVGSRHDAEDLLQETFLTAYRNLGRYDSKRNFATWLFTIAYRLTVSKWRQHPRAGASSPVVEQCDASNPLSEVLQEEMRSQLWDAARQNLDLESFAALWLKYAESMSADEIALILGRNANAIRILLYRARQHLAEQRIWTV